MLKKQFPASHAFARAHRFDLYFDAQLSGYLPFRSYLYDRLDKLIFISEHGLEYFSMLLHIKEKSKLILSRLGIQNEPGHGAFTKNNKLKIVSCSYVTYNKRVDLIAEALSVTDLKIEWVHIGNGFDNPDYQPIKDRIAILLKDKKNINYHFAGHLSNRAIFEYYYHHNFNLFINLSKSEGLPVSIMEAMSFGIPVIATAVGGTPEIVEHKYNGLLMKPTPTQQEVKKAIEFFHAIDDEQYRKYCSNAYQTWFTKFNADTNYPAFINEIMNL